MYDAVNAAVLARIPRHCTRLLDIGCGSGALGAAVKRRQPCHVVGITHRDDEAGAARRCLDEVRVADLDDAALPLPTDVDTVVCSHVLEHLKSPERLLRGLAACLEGRGELVVALPNVLFWRQRWQFVRGRFRYTDGGLMDRTHLRFFDYASARALLETSGWRVVEAHADGGLPGSRRLPRGLRVRFDRAAVERWPGLLGHQFVLRAVPAR